MSPFSIMVNTVLQIYEVIEVSKIKAFQIEILGCRGGDGKRKIESYMGGGGQIEFFPGKIHSDHFLLRVIWKRKCTHNLYVCGDTKRRKINCSGGGQRNDR